MNAINAPKHKAKLYNHNKWIEGNYFSRQETTYCFTEDYLRNPPKTLHYIAVDTMTDWGLPNEFRLYPIDPDTLCCSTGKTDINDQPLFTNDIISYDPDGYGAYGTCTGIIKFGEYRQDASGGEYSGKLCLGYYVELLSITPYDWMEETSEEALEYFPYYLRKYSLIEFLKDTNSNVTKIGNVIDNPELMKGENNGTRN